MDVQKVIEIVQGLQSKLTDIDSLSTEYSLSVETDGTVWNVKFLGAILVSSEDYDILISSKDYNENISLSDQILNELDDIKKYLNLVLKGK